jgi:hypothetical protein
MATLQEIRKKLQQSKQQADVVLTPTQTKAKLKRIKELLARLKKGEDITRRDLKSVLTEQQWKDFEQANSYMDVDYTEVVERPQELNAYMEKMKQGDFYHARAESTPVTDRTRRGNNNSTGRQRLYTKAESCYEDAVMYLCSLLDGNDARLAQEIRLWLDRDVDTRVGYEPSIDPQGVPRIRGSRSKHSDSTKSVNKYEIKRQNKKEALENAISALKS